MSHGQAALLGRDRAGHGAVHVSDDKAQVAALPQEQALVPDHDSGALLGLGATPHFEVDVGRRDAELIEEPARHHVVIVLTRVHQSMPNDAAKAPPTNDLGDDGRYLHEVGACADDHVNARSRHA
jgi:hypothetical protein